jgi:hypothetical protein
MKKIKSEPQTAVLVMLNGKKLKYASALISWLTSRGITYNAPGLVRKRKAASAAR